MHRRMHPDAASLVRAPSQSAKRRSSAAAHACTGTPKPERASAATVRAPLARAARYPWTRLRTKRDTRRQRHAEKARVQGEAKREWQRTGEVGRPPTLVGPRAR